MRFAGVGALLLVVGCGSSGGAPPDAGDGAAAEVSPHAVAEEVHRAACERAVACGTQPSIDDCLTSTVSPVGARIEADLASGDVVYHEQAAQLLAGWLAAVPCGYTAEKNRVAVEELAARCAAAFTGVVPAGGPCAADAECAAGLACSHVQGGVMTTAGHCDDAPPIVPVGEFCGGRGDACGPQGACDYVNHPDNPLCAPLSTTAGAPCIDAEQGCGGGLLCITGVCGALPRTGATCDPAIAGTFAPCDDERDVCDPTSKTCGRARQLGAPCAPAARDCGPSLWCDPAKGTCAARARAGDDCRAGRECLGDLSCGAADGTCTLIPELAAGTLMICP